MIDGVIAYSGEILENKAKYKAWGMKYEPFNESYRRELREAPTSRDIKENDKMLNIIIDGELALQVNQLVFNSQLLRG